MNNRQAGAFRELVRKEERCREKWYEIHAGSNTGSYGYVKPGDIPSPSGVAATLQTQQPLSAPSQTFSLFAPPASINGPNITIRSQAELDRALPALAAHTVYDQAIRISTPRVLEESVDEHGYPIRRVLRQVEVPYLRQVKVPVKTRKIIPVVVQKKIKTKKLVEIPAAKVVDEEYTEVLQQPAVRNKEIYVKKKIGTVVRQIVPERYLKPVEVKRTRKVQIPSTVLREIDDYEVVDVTENRAVEVDGYRVDEVQDSRLVEVEEIQSEQHGGAHGYAQVIATREIGPVRGVHHARRIGTEVYHPLDARHASIDEDIVPDDTQRVTAAFSKLTHQAQLVAEHAALASRASRAARFANRQQAAKQSFAQTARQAVNNQYSIGNAAFHATQPAMVQSARAPLPAQPLYPPHSAAQSAGAALSAHNDSSFTHKIGFSVRSSDANGCVVTRVEANEAGARGGVCKGDLVVYANNRPTRTLQEFRAVMLNSSGPIQLQVRRRGVGRLQLTVQR